MDYLDGPRPRLFAHRGGALEAPENTIEAFAAGLEAGADRLELDVHATSDGEIVVLHDERVDRTTDGSGLVRELDLAGVKELDAGANFEADDGRRPFAGGSVRIPTFIELLEAFPGVPLNIEIKQDAPAIEARVLAILDEFSARGRVLLAAEDNGIMRRIRALAPDLHFGASTDNVVEFIQAWQNDALAGYEPCGVALQVPARFMDTPLVTPEFVEVAHRVGFEVHVWTVDDEAEMEHLLGLGVDGIMTDRPTLAARVYGRLGLR